MARVEETHDTTTYTFGGAGVVLTAHQRPGQVIMIGFFSLSVRGYSIRGYDTIVRIQRPGKVNE